MKDKQINGVNDYMCVLFGHDQVIKSDYLHSGRNMSLVSV